MSLNKKEERQLSKMTATAAKNVQALLDFIQMVDLADDGKGDMPEPKVGDLVRFPGSSLGLNLPDIEAYITGVDDIGNVTFQSTGFFAGSWRDLFEAEELDTLLTLESNGYIKAIDDETRHYIIAFKHLKKKLMIDTMWIPKSRDSQNKVCKEALTEAASKFSAFGACSSSAWLGTPHGSGYACYVHWDGDVYNYGSRSYSCVVAPAFAISYENLINLYGKGLIKWEAEYGD